MNTPKEKLWNSNYCHVWTANFLLYFSFMLLTPLFPLYLSETFDADKQMIGFVLSAYAVVALFVRPFSGYLVDSFPRRKVLLVSFFILFLFFIGYPLCGSILMFAAVRTLHGAPFGTATVANSTVAIDVLPASRRAEGIGYYGLSNNIASAISPSIALFIFGITNDYDSLFYLAIITSALAFYCNYRVKLPEKPIDPKPATKLSLDRFLLLKAWRQGLCIACFAFSYGVLSTYLAIYGKEELGITGGTGLFFFLLAGGLTLSRITGGRTLGQGKIIRNATMGVLLSLVGYLVFAALHNHWGYYGAALIIGLGNGHMFPAFQTMFLNLAENSQRGTANSSLYVAWDGGFAIGVLLGGVVAEHFGYHTAFWVMWLTNLGGALFYLVYARRHFIAKRLR